MKEKNQVFHHDVLLLWNVFAVLNLKIFVMLKDLTVRWLIEKTTLLEEKNLFSLLGVYKLVMFLSRLQNRQAWSPGILPLPPQSPIIPLNNI